MDISNKEFWFTLEPYIHSVIKRNKVFLYNTLDGVSLVSQDIEVINLVSKVYEIENAGVVRLSGKELLSPNIKQFIEDIRKNFMGDIVDVTFSIVKPVQLLPIKNIQGSSDQFSVGKNDSGKNFIQYLREVVFFLDDHETFPIKLYPCKKIKAPYTNVNQVNIDELLNPFTDLSHLIVSVVMKDLFGHPQIQNIYQKLSLSSIPVIQYIIHYSSFINFNDNYEFIDKFRFIINIDFPVSLDMWNKCIDIINKYHLHCDYHLLISSEEELDMAQEFINRSSFEDYELIPIYNYDNLCFFKKYIYITENDLADTPVSMQEIFMNQTLNKIDFGKLYVLNSGDILTNLYRALPNGNIRKNSINDLVSKEFKNNSSWLRIRDNKPCSNCVNQWLCPSPSNYELILNKSNLCHIK